MVSYHIIKYYIYHVKLYYKNTIYDFKTVSIFGTPLVVNN